MTPRKRKLRVPSGVVVEEPVAVVVGDGVADVAAVVAVAGGAVVLPVVARFTASCGCQTTFDSKVKLLRGGTPLQFFLNRCLVGDGRVVTCCVGFVMQQTEGYLARAVAILIDMRGGVALVMIIYLYLLAPKTIHG